MSLQFEKEIAAAKDRRQPIGKSTCAVVSFVRECRRKRAFAATGQADQPRRKLLYIVKRGCAFRLGRFAHFETRNQLAKILISGLGCAEQCNARWLVGVLVRKPFGWL